MIEQDEDEEKSILELMIELGEASNELIKNLIDSGVCSEDELLDDEDE